MSSLQNRLRLTMLAVATVLSSVAGTVAHAQSPTLETRSFPLKYADQTNDGSEILTAVRLMLDPGVKLFLLPSSNVLLVKGTAEQIAEAGRLIEQLDKPHRSFRLVFAIDEVDGKTHVSTTHVDMVIAPNQRTTLRNGSKVPVLTGSYNTGSAPGSGAAGVQTQYTYLDIGLSFDVTLDTSMNEFMLKASVDQSSVAEEKTTVIAGDPVVRQTKLDGISVLTLGKPVRLGALDIPGTTRHEEIGVTLEEIK